MSAMYWTDRGVDKPRWISFIVVHASANGVEFLPYDYLLKFCFQTTRAAIKLILSGTTIRCDQVRFIFSHMGGTAPYLGWRVNSCFSTTANGERPLLMADEVWNSWNQSDGSRCFIRMRNGYFGNCLPNHKGMQAGTGKVPAVFWLSCLKTLTLQRL